jgi:hypothetical protein
LLFLREKALYAARLDVNHLALAGPVVKMLDNVAAVPRQNSISRFQGTSTPGITQPFGQVDR